MFLVWLCWAGELVIHRWMAGNDIDEAGAAVLSDILVKLPLLERLQVNGA